MKKLNYCKIKHIELEANKGVDFNYCGLEALALSIVEGIDVKYLFDNVKYYIKLSDIMKCIKEEEK